MKEVMLTVGILFLIKSIHCQTESLGDWIVNVNAGIEAHDKRLFNYARPEREALLKMHPEFWGTHHFGLNVRRKVWQSRRVSSYLGLGVSYETATFQRPFDHFHFLTFAPDILKYQNIYKKIQLPITLSAFYELGDRWIISGKVTSDFLVFRSVEHTENRSTFYQEGSFELDDIQLMLCVNYRIGKFMVGLHSRVVNFQKIDRIIFNDIIKDPRTDQKWEWNNPLRFDLAVGYTW